MFLRRRQNCLHCAIFPTYYIVSITKHTSSGVSFLLLRYFLSANWLGYNTIDENESKIPHKSIGCYTTSKTSKDKYCNLGKYRFWIKG
jgi:hypothetical protein